MKRKSIFLMVVLLVGALTVQAEEKDKLTRVIEVKDGNVVVHDNGEVVAVGPDQDLIFEDFDGTKRGFLGVYLQELTPDLRTYFSVPEGTGVLISSVTEEGPAAKAGLKAGDVITAINGEKVNTSIDVGRKIRNMKEGDQARIEVTRRGAPQQLFATIGERARPQIMLRRLPEGKELMWIDEKSGEAVDRLRTYLESPEWKVRVNRLGDCDELRTRLDELEKRLAELQKKMQEK